jgi:Flp pilus assembly protein TadB
MLAMLTAPALTLLFLGVVAALGAAFAWMFWEIEQAKARRNRARLGVVARPPHRKRPG